MKIPILTEKLIAPQLPASYLPRSRLDAAWRSWSDKRLVLVMAGAGFGKTSFLAANATDGERASIWYGLDELDVELVTFCAHLLQAVGGEESAGEICAAPATDDFANEVLAALVAVLRRRSGGSVIILDDVQHVVASSSVIHFIERLIRYLPEGNTLILSSREPVGVATMKLRSLGTVATITAADLAFTADEVAVLFQLHFPGIELSDRLQHKIAKRTEGWAAGIEILFQVLPNASAAQIDRTLEQLQAAGSGWFTYFAEEVVRQLDEPTRDFLHRSSVLPRLEPELCDAVMNRDDSRSVLTELRRRNLFIYGSDEQASTYRYHHLFRDFLRYQLEQTAGLKEVRRLQQRAAVALRDAEAWAEAIVAFAECGDHEATLSLVARASEELLATGRYELIRKAVTVVPDRLLARQPAARLLLARVAEVQGRWQEAEEIYLKILRSRRAGLPRTELMANIARLKLRRGEYGASAKLCQRALDQPGRMSTRIRGDILDMLGVCACELGRLDEGERYLKKAISIFRRVGNVESESDTFYLLPGNIHYRRGEFQKAKEAARRALVVFRRQNNRRRICHCLGVLAFVTADAAEQQEARELADECLRMAERLEYRVMEGYGHLALGRCALLAADLERARDHFQTARLLGERVGETGLRTFPLLGLAEVALAAGRRAQAREHAESALAVSRQIASVYQEAQSYLLLGGLASNRSAASRWWNRAERIIRRVGMKYDLHRLLLFRLAAGNLPPPKAAVAVRELVTGCATENHDFLLLTVAPELAARVLPEALRLGIENSYVEQLLLQLGPAAIPHLEALAGEGDATLQQRSVQLLSRIGGDQARTVLAGLADEHSTAGRAALAAAAELGHTPAVPLRISALGPLLVEVGNHELTLDRWRSARALRLFQFLIIHRFRWLPRDVILESLWPDAEPRKGVNNLRQTIHVLRKTLEPGHDTARQSAYVRYRNEACRLVPGESYYFDVETFEDTLSRADVAWNTEGKNAAETHLLAAVDLYRGDFLVESPYEEFAAIEREQLRDRLLRAMGRLLTLYAENDRWAKLVPLCRRALTLDRYHEEFYWHLVHAQFEQGHRHEALADYHQYEEMMTGEMDLLPSARMKALADKVVAMGR